MKKILLVVLMALCSASLSYAEMDEEECTMNCARIYGSSDDLLAECYSGCRKTYYNVTPNAKNDDPPSEYELPSRSVEPDGSNRSGLPIYIPGARY